MIKVGRWVVPWLLLTGCSDSTAPGELDDARPTDYLTAEAIVDELRRSAARAPSIAEVVDLTDRYGTPQTHQGHHIFAMRISDDVGTDQDEPSFLLVAAHHGNEMSTPVVALDAIYRLTEGYGVDPTVTQLIDEYEIWIAPLWNPDGYPLSRKNGNPQGSVDLNRNYPFLWQTDCSGSTDPQSGNFKGAAPGSEPEVQTMVAFAEDRRFTKVLDYHSFGRETLYAYRCSPHRLLSYLRSEAVALSFASGYAGRVRPPSAEGEHYEWQLGTFSNYAFLTEIGDSHSPTFQEAMTEAELLWPGTVWMLQRPIPVRGHVIDGVTRAPLEASITYLESPFTQGEQNRSEPRFGRFHAFLPIGTHTLRFSHPDYLEEEVTVSVPSDGVDIEVSLTRPGLQ